ncbi:MAG: hypothetical protein LBM72_00635 [Mycoplasmataceae bacterium]|nr:hypothetical protein [Mycoplasmataceae bacterium]
MTWYVPAGHEELTVRLVDVLGASLIVIWSVDVPSNARCQLPPVCKSPGMYSLYYKILAESL